MSNIDYTAYKRAYTTGDQFTLTGSDFIGYAELVDGVAKEVGTGKVLTPKGSYATDLFFTPYFTDRVEVILISLYLQQKTSAYSVLMITSTTILLSLSLTL